MTGGRRKQTMANERLELDLLSTRWLFNSFNSSPENESRSYFRLSVNGVTNTMDVDSGEGEGVFR